LVSRIHFLSKQGIFENKMNRELDYKNENQFDSIAQERRSDNFILNEVPLRKEIV